MSAMHQTPKVAQDALHVLALAAVNLAQCQTGRVGVYVGRLGNRERRPVDLTRFVEAEKNPDGSWFATAIHDEWTAEDWVRLIVETKPNRHDGQTRMIVQITLPEIF